MVGPKGAEALSEPQSGAGDSGATETQQALVESRHPLQELERRLEDGRDVEPNEVNEARYWLYEHLRRLSLAASDLLDEFQRDVSLPIDFENDHTQYIKPLLAIYDDLLIYYWRPNCLMGEFAENGVDLALYTAINAGRQDWGRLHNAIRQYLAACQEEESPAKAKGRIITGREFESMFHEFVKLLSALVNRDGFKSVHSGLAKSANRPPPRKRGRVRRQ